MTNFQQAIYEKVLIDVGFGSGVVSEDSIRNYVDIYNKTFVYGLSEAQKQEVIRNLHAKFSIHMDTGSILRDEKKHIPWYLATKDRCSSHFWDQYRKYLLSKKHWTNNLINSLDKVTDSIMDSLGNPSSPNIFSYRGLCIGDVQSGKTSTYIGLMNKAADAKYRVFILLAGTIEKLRQQTQQRVNEGFLGLEAKNFTPEMGIHEFGDVSIVTDLRGVSLTSTSSDFNAASAKKWIGKLASINGPIVFVVKKNKSVLEKLEQWLRSFNADRITKKINLPMILIDDEADNASVNTKKSDVTVINRDIRKLLELFERSNYVGFTATPYANIFIDPDSDQEMLGQDLFPSDFIFALDSPTNYIGARSIFGEDAKYGYMLESNDDCEDALPLNHKKDASLAYLPSSLKEAISAFFIVNAIRDLRGEKKSHRTMMVNISRFIDVQKQIAEEIDQYTRDMKNEIHCFYLMGEEGLKYGSIKFLKGVYDKYFAGNADNAAFLDLQHFPWAEIQEALYPAISRIEIRAVNGRNASKSLDYNTYETEQNNIGLRVIVVGGLSLSRGLTLEGLSTSYFYRNSSMYDTLMQMGRWFGYRDSYRDLCKVWMPELSMSWYQYISMATDNLREEVKIMQDEQGRTPADFGLAVRSDVKGLLVTARNKMRLATDFTTTVNLSGDVVETRYVYSSNEILKQNYLLTENFLNDLSHSYIIHRNDSLLASESYQYLNITKEKVVDYLKQYRVHPLSMDFALTEMVKMVEADDQHVFDAWDVVIASGEKGTPCIHFGGFDIPPVKRKFAYRDDTKSIQMSGKNSRLGSKNLAKGGLTAETVKKMEAGVERKGKAFSENFYFNTGIKRNPLLVIYPVELELSGDGAVLEKKKEIATSITCPIVGLGIGVPSIQGKQKEKIKYKINKRKRDEIFEVDQSEDFEEVDETIED